MDERNNAMPPVKPPDINDLSPAPYWQSHDWLHREGRPPDTRAPRQNKNRQPCEKPHRAPPCPANRARSTQTCGNLAETQALRHLQKAGLILLARNLQCRSGEIDLVMRDGRELVFVEVRQRAQNSHGGAAASVDQHKQRRLALAAAYFLPKLAKAHFQSGMPRCRFDVAAIEQDQLVWLRNAFQTN